MELFLALLGEILAQRVFYVLLREEDVNTLEVGVVWCHTVVLQSRNGLHTLLRHILLSQCDGHLLGAVVTEIDEDDDVALFDRTIY